MPSGWILFLIGSKALLYSSTVPKYQALRKVYGNSWVYSPWEDKRVLWGMRNSGLWSGLGHSTNIHQLSDFAGIVIPVLFWLDDHRYYHKHFMLTISCPSTEKSLWPALVPQLLRQEIWGSEKAVTCPKSHREEVASLNLSVELAQDHHTHCSMYFTLKNCIIAFSMLMSQGCWEKPMVNI